MCLPVAAPPELGLQRTEDRDVPSAGLQPAVVPLRHVHGKVAQPMVPQRCGARKSGAPTPTKTATCCSRPHASLAASHKGGRKRCSTRAGVRHCLRLCPLNGPGSRAAHSFVGQRG
mmetsp:Transcript_78593/g.138847  ORF Transcript_78593/g.138847 Transcript_78593/m.138847 type:complete len:116 (-) Transcript_78593:449-796(-)